MAVEARHLHLFPPQFLTTNNREMMMMNGVPEGHVNGDMYDSSNSVVGYGVVAPPLSAGAADMVVPMYDSTALADPVPAKKSDGGGCSSSRKRSRDEFNNPPMGSYFVPNQCSSRGSDQPFTFLGEDFSAQIHQQQLELDHFITQHMEKVKMEIEERRKRHLRRIAMAVELTMMKKLRAKDAEIENMNRLNWALEERVNSLSVENQIWRDLAQNNEATANSLRLNLEQVLSAQLHNNNQENDNNQRVAAAELAGDAESSCSNETGGSNDGGGGRRCRRCGESEACVLILPCRHLCLCSVCGSSLNICPVCRRTKTASLHVNLDS